jgi:HSP20 family protein
MSLIRWHPWRELETIRHQMDHLFEELMHTDHVLPLWGKPDQGEPAIELQETDTNFILKAEVPGIEAQDLDVQVTEECVSLKGKRQESTQTEANGLFRSEFRYGQFQRIIPLSGQIAKDQVQCEFKQGVLTLILPKVRGTSRKGVKVDVAAQMRQDITQQRQQAEQREAALHSRAAAALATPTTGNLEATMREQVVEQRQHEEHQQETAHTRVAAEIDVTS